MSVVMPAVKALISKDDKFLIVKQKIGDLEVWDLPGGRVQFGESPYDTLFREVKEETGLEVEIVKPLGMWWFIRNKDGNQVVCNTFICAPKSSEVNTLSNADAVEEISEHKWVTKEELLNDYNFSHDSLKELIKKL